MKYQSFKTELATPGQKVVSYPNHQGESLEGVITDINHDLKEIRINYYNRGNTTLQLDGKFRKGMDTNLDINLLGWE